MPKKGQPGKRKIDSLPMSPTGELMPPPFKATQKHSQLERPKGGNSAARKAEVIIAALLGGHTLDATAKIAKVHRRTVDTYLASPWFQELFASAKKNLLDETISHLRGYATEAVRGLHEVLVDRSVAPIARVSAGREMLNAMLRAVELEDVVGQLEALKQEIRTSKESYL